MLLGLDNARKTNLLIWSVFCVIVMLEFLFFRHFIQHYIANFYPTNFDQTSFLPLSYHLYENIKAQGILSGFIASPQSPTGVLFIPQAVLFYLIFGASRLTALLPNFIYFILLQFFMITAIRTLSNRVYLVPLTIGFVLSLNIPFIDAGGMFDFRMDFIAFCLYGIFISTVIKSKFFLNRKWMLISALTVSFLVLLRGITLTYLMMLATSLTIYFAWQYRKRNALLLPDVHRLRFFNLLIFDGCLFFVASTYIWLNRIALYHYYVLAHLGPEKYIRAQAAGVTNLLTKFSFYPASLFQHHIGNLTLHLIIGFSIIYLLILVLLSADRSDERLSLTKQTDWKLCFLFLFLSIISPLIILTLDVDRSTVVGSIMAAPTLLMLLCGYAYIDATYRYYPLANYSKWLLTGSASIVLLAGLAHHFKSSHHLRHFQRNDLKSITQMYQAIGRYAEKANWQKIQFSIDQITDYLNCGNQAVLYYEMNKKLFTTGVGLAGGTIFAITKQQALESLKNSNVVILELNNAVKNSPFPFNQSITKLKPILKQFAERHLMRLGDYSFKGSTYRVYVKK